MHRTRGVGTCVVHQKVVLILDFWATDCQERGCNIVRWCNLYSGHFLWFFFAPKLTFFCRFSLKGCRKLTYLAYYFFWVRWKTVPGAKLVHPTRLGRVTPLLESSSCDNPGTSEVKRPAQTCLMNKFDPLGASSALRINDFLWKLSKMCPHKAWEYRLYIGGKLPILSGVSAHIRHTLYLCAICVLHVRPIDNRSKKFHFFCDVSRTSPESRAWIPQLPGSSPFFRKVTQLGCTGKDSFEAASSRKLPPPR